MTERLSRDVVLDDGRDALSVYELDPTDDGGLLIRLDRRGDDYFLSLTDMECPDGAWFSVPVSSADALGLAAALSRFGMRATAAAARKAGED